jgi:prophage tail gpP-like protein
VANPYDLDQPELGSIVIRLPYAGAIENPEVEFSHFLSYRYSDNFLIPSDAWTFTLATDELSDSDKAALNEGARVEISIDDQVQSIGFIDEVKCHGNRESGAITTITGYDWLHPAVQGHVDPGLKFKPGQTLEQFLETVFAEFFVKVLSVDNITNRNATTGRIYGTPVSKKGKPLKSYSLHKLQPYPNEGAFAFASRVAQRFGLWIWPAADGETVIVGQPDFSQPSRYQIRLKNDGGAANNVLDWDVTSARGDQPGIIFASGFGGGGEFANSTLRTYVINPMLVSPQSDYDEAVKKYPGIVQTGVPFPALGSAIATGPLPTGVLKKLYLYDPESHDIAELQAYVRRELALHMRKSLAAKYTIMGHRLGGQPIAIDTMVDVDDDLSNVHIPLWVLGREFMKDSQGTRTTIDLIRPGTLAFGPGSNSV